MTLAPGVSFFHWDYTHGHIFFTSGRAMLAALRDAVACFGRNL
jgi:hypothetical protein